jgi:hypothetical protein
MRRKQLRAKNGSMSSGSTFQDVFFSSNDDIHDDVFGFSAAHD